MTNNKLAFAIISIVIASITLSIGTSQIQTSIAVETPKGNNAYIFAEGVSPHLTFKFTNGIEEADFQVFTQTSGLTGSQGKSSAPEFTLVKVPGNTPYLYQAADELLSRSFGNNIEFQYNRFDVTVDLMQAGEQVRSFQYNGCEVNSYRVYTDYDKEEAYTTGKTGFAVQDEFKILCKGYHPQNPQLNKINNISPEQTTKSTLDWNLEQLQNK